MSERTAGDTGKVTTETPQPGFRPKRMIPDADGKFEGAHLGINTTKLEAYVGTQTWKIRPDGHTKFIVDQLRAIQKTFEISARALEDNPQAMTYEKEEVYETATKAMLELALEGFSYESAANHVDVGVGALGLLSNEVRSFLVDLGGRDVSKHWQMLSKLVTQSGSNGMKG